VQEAEKDERAAFEISRRGGHLRLPEEETDERAHDE
jgi:hypothetical protein